MGSQAIDLSKFPGMTLSDKMPGAQAEQTTAAAPKPTGSIADRALHNLPASLKSVIEMTPGVPHDAPLPQSDEHYDSTWDAIKGNAGKMGHEIAAPFMAAYQKVKALADAPEETIKEAFANDPAGTLALPIQLARGVVAGAASPAARAAAADVAKGGSKLAGAITLHHSGLGGLAGEFGTYGIAKSGFKDMLNAVKSAWAGRPELGVEAPPPPTGGPSAPASAAVQRVQEAFDPATARPAPPTSAPGNAVYEHGPVDIPKPAAAAPGAAPARGTVQPIDYSNVGPRANFGEGPVPALPGSSGLSPVESSASAVENRATPSAGASSSVGQPASVSSREGLSFEPPHPVYDKLARDPELMGKFKELRDMLHDKGELGDEPGSPGHNAFLDRNTSGLQIGPEVSNRQGVVKKLADHFEQGGMSHEDILSRAEHPAADQVMWKNAVAMSKASKQKNYMPSPATKEAVVDEVKRRAVAQTGPR